MVVRDGRHDSAQACFLLSGESPKTQCMTAEIPECQLQNELFQFSKANGTNLNLVNCRHLKSWATHPTSIAKPDKAFGSGGLSVSAHIAQLPNYSRFGR